MLIGQAEAAISQGNSQLAAKLVSQALDFRWKAVGFNHHSFCDRFKWDQENIETQLEVESFSRKLGELRGPSADYSILESIEKFELSTYNFRNLESTMRRSDCPAELRRATYKETFNKILAADTKARSIYEEVAKKPFVEGWRKYKRDVFEAERANKWDSLSREERSSAAGNDPAVLACLDAALAENAAAKGVNNIVRDAAALCRHGLR